MDDRIEHRAKVQQLSEKLKGKRDLKACEQARNEYEEILVGTDYCARGNQPNRPCV